MRKEANVYLFTNNFIVVGIKFSSQFGIAQTIFCERARRGVVARKKVEKAISIEERGERQWDTRCEKVISVGGSTSRCSGLARPL